MKLFIILAFSGFAVFLLMIFIYHWFLNIALQNKIYNKFLGGLIFVVGLLLAFAIWEQYQESAMNRSYLLYSFLCLLGLVLANCLILKYNYHRYTCSLFKEGRVFDFEVERFAHGYVLGKIYWDKINHPHRYCLGCIKADYEDKSFGELRKEYEKNLAIGKKFNYKVKFDNDCCYSRYISNMVNFVTLVDDNKEE